MALGLGIGIPFAAATTAGWAPSDVSGLLQWLHEVDGHWFKDKSNTGTDRILNGGPGLQQGQCLILDGVNQYVDTGLDPAFGASLSVFGWINTAGVVGALASHYAGASRSWVINIHAGGVVRVLLSDDGTFPGASGKRYETTATVNDSAWHHIGFTFSGGVLTLYIDGVEAAVTKVVDNAMATVFDPAANVLLGAITTGTGQQLAGSIFDTQIFTDALSTDEITWLYTFGADGTDPGVANLLGGYRLDEQSGLIAYDSSGNGNHGTLVNDPTYTTQDIKSWQNDVGYSLSGAVFVPRDESDTENDVLGNALDYSGVAPRHGKWVDHNALRFAAISSQYCSLGNLAVSPQSIAFRMRAAQITSFTGCIFDLNGTDYIQIVDGTISTVGFSAATVNVYVDGAVGSVIADTTEYHSVVITSSLGFSASAAYLGAMAGSGTYADMGICDLRLSTDEWSAADALTYHEEYGGATTLSNIVKWWPLAEGDDTIYEVMNGAAGKFCTAGPTVERQGMFAYNLHRGFYQATALFPRVPALDDGTASANNFGTAINHPAVNGSNGAESRIDFDPFAIPALSNATLGFSLYHAYDLQSDDLHKINRWFVKRVTQDFEESNFMLYAADLTGADWDSMHAYLATVAQLNARIQHYWACEAWSGSSPQTLDDEIGSMDLQEDYDQQGTVAGQNNTAIQTTDTGASPDDSSVYATAPSDMNTSMAITHCGWLNVVAENGAGLDGSILNQNSGSQKLEVIDGAGTLKWTFNSQVVNSSALAGTGFSFYVLARDVSGNLTLWLNGVYENVAKGVAMPTGTGTFKFLEDGAAQGFDVYQDELMAFGTNKLRDSHVSFLSVGKYLNTTTNLFEA